MITIGVIGAGNWGSQLIRKFHHLHDAELAWVSDLQSSRLASLQARYPQMRTSQDYHELLASDVDAVVIATPASLHYRMAIETLHEAKHVFVEKPLALTAAQAESIVHEAKQRDRVVMVGHICEYNPAVETIRMLVANGELGDLYYINTVRGSLGPPKPDVNVAWDLAIHDISLIRFILDLEPLTVHAQGEIYPQRLCGLHQVVHLTLHYPKGLMAHIGVSWLDPYKTRQCTIVGSKKTLVYDDTHPEHKLFVVGRNDDPLPFVKHDQPVPPSTPYNGAWSYPISQAEPLEVECQHFLNAIHTGKEPRSNGRIGLHVVRILEAAQASLQHRGQRKELQWNMATSYASPQMLNSATT